MSGKYRDFYFLPYSFFLSAFLAIDTLFMQPEKRAFLFWGKINITDLENTAKSFAI